MSEGQASAAGRPAGDVYDWFQRAERLLSTGSPGPAAHLLRRVLDVEPGSRSAREALARALFDSGHYDDAEGAFRSLTQDYPDDDYAMFGLGLALSRQGRFEQAANYLSAASTMRPARKDYREALRQVQATLRARKQPG